MKKVEEILINLEEIEKKYFPARWLDKNKNVDEDKTIKPDLDSDNDIVADQKYFHTREVFLLEEQKKNLEKTLKEKTEDFEKFKSELIKSNQFLFEEIERRIVEIEIIKKQFSEEKERFNNIISEKDKTILAISNEIQSFPDLFDKFSLTVQNSLTNSLELSESEKKNIRESEKNTYNMELNKLKDECEKRIENELKAQRKETSRKYVDRYVKSLDKHKQFIHKTLKGQLDRTNEISDVMSTIINYTVSNYEMSNALKEQIKELDTSLNEMKLINEKLFNSLNIQTLKKEKINVYDVINQILESYNNIIKEKKITLNYIINEPVFIYTDTALVFKVLSNVISNSIDSIEMTLGGNIDISVEKYKDIDLFEDFIVKLSISDNGTGIPDEYLAKIFQPFYSTKRGMLGLGLNQSDFIMQLLGGDIKIESKKMKGTNVELNFYPIFANLLQ